MIMIQIQSSRTQVIKDFSHWLCRYSLCLFIFILICLGETVAQDTELSRLGISVIPYPKAVIVKGDNFILDNTVTIVTDAKPSASDMFSVAELIKFLDDELDLKPSIANKISPKSIVLTHRGADKSLGEEGYSVTVEGNKVMIKAVGDAGLFYGVQTVVQLIQVKDSLGCIPGMQIRDWPDTKTRAVHYDTKHHQDTRAFVENFIRDLARYKINMLVWEWEDKFEYPSHPEIGAPGAFTMVEMQQLTRYAQKFHIQIVPLVQGLGHVSFILKWPQFAHLREIPASNFEFCPLKEDAYKLLQELWLDAMKATPGSNYLHIGSDETYELGACPQCKKKEGEIGKSGLYHLFIGKSAKLIQSAGREVMVWEAPMGWEQRRLSAYHKDIDLEKDKVVVPQKGIVLTESYEYETSDLKYAKKAKSLGYPIYAYDPNPGIEQLFLPYFYTQGDGIRKEGSLKMSYNFLTSTLGNGVFDGVIRTSWDDAGLPMQAWMLCFATTAAYSWNASAPSLNEFTSTFFKNRYGKEALDMEMLYKLLNEGAYFYMESFERRVWHWGNIGKTHLPDLPRWDAVEYNPYWNLEYADRVSRARECLEKMNQAISICDKNLAKKLDNRYDVEVFQTIAQLVRHTALTYLDLSQLENAVTEAHENRFVNLEETYKSLKKAEKIVEGQMERRQNVYASLVAKWEETRLPKGVSTPSEKYFFEQDRTRHFANRVPDMSYLIVDEQLLGLEEYLVKLKAYLKVFRDRYSVGRD